MRKLISIFLLIALLGAALASCGGGDAPSAPIAAETSAQDSAEETTADPGPVFPDGDYDGYEFRLLSYDPSGLSWPVGFGSEAMDGEPINDGTYTRNLDVQEKYNVVFKVNESASVASDAAKSISAGDDAFDFIASTPFDTTTLAKSSMLLDMCKLDGIDFTNPWWDQSSVRDFSIGRHVFFVCGDIDYHANLGAWVFLFSKTMVHNYGLEDPYALIADGTWTVDKFIEMTTGIAGDANGDGKMDQNDRYGLVTESYNSLGMFFGAGCRTISKDEDDYPVITVDTPRGEEVVTKVLKLMNDTNSTANINQGYYGSWEELDAVFGDERCLFYSIVLQTVMRIRQVDIDFGIIPMPKYDEAQDTYDTWVSPFIARAVGVPVTGGDPDRTGILLEYMGWSSMENIKGAVYDTTLERKLTRDDESAGTLDIIFGNRVYDLGCIYDWGGVGTFIPGMSFTNKEFASTYAALASKAQAALDTANEQLRTLG